MISGFFFIFPCKQVQRFFLSSFCHLLVDGAFEGKEGANYLLPTGSNGLGGDSIFGLGSFTKVTDWDVVQLILFRSVTSYSSWILLFV